MGVPACCHRYELNRCILHRALHGRLSGEHLADPLGSECLSIRWRRSATILPGSRDFAVLLAAAALDVSAETVSENLRLTTRRRISLSRTSAAALIDLFNSVKIGDVVSRVEALPVAL